MDREKTGTGSPAVSPLQRIAAIAAIVLLVGMYIVTFVLAVLGDERSTRLLRFCFGMTIFVPIFLWVVIWCVGFLRHKKSIASLDLLNSNPEERRKMEEAVAKEMDKGQEGVSSGTFRNVNNKEGT